MTDASKLKGLLSRNSDTVQVPGYWMRFFWILLFISFIYQSVCILYNCLLPIPAEDYQRFDAAIEVLANKKQTTKNTIWHDVFFRLHVNELSDLRLKHAAMISDMIVDELRNIDP